MLNLKLQCCTQSFTKIFLRCERLLFVCFGLRQDPCLGLKLSKCLKSNILSVDTELYHVLSGKIVLKANLN